MEKLLTIQEFADIVRLSPRTIQYHISNGDIEVLRYDVSGLGCYSRPMRIEQSQVKPFVEKVYKRYKGTERCETPSDDVV